ncbi:MAG: alpha-amylase family protein, partial [Spirochaetaceae bacterium]|nr:alpha-amylase family protein [Spirochaetaceae bacterium]
MTFSNTKILSRIEKNVLQPYRKKTGYDDFYNHLKIGFPYLIEHLGKLYGSRPDFIYHIEDIIQESCKIYLNRTDIKKTGESNTTRNMYLGSQNEIGAVFYVDLFAGKLQDIKKRIPYLKELGITFVHLMPLFKTPPGETDGGYAVSSYRHIAKRFGTMNDLRELIEEFDLNGINLVLDFILNHTSDQHEWAKKAKSGDIKYQNYYYIFKEKNELEEYSPYLRDIFPEVRKGSFTFDESMQSWVWTTFNSFQWDLNYSNPEVFLQMMKEMFFLANLGVKVLRFDAPAFIWKQKGSSCENLPEVHTIIKAFKAIMNVVFPDVLFLSEAIVHPDEIKKYISKSECELSYNPLLMATLWESLATRKTNLLQKSMERYSSLPKGCYWINYIRCHDDIGWTFSDQDAWDIGIDPSGHRHFLNNFYTGKFEGSFAKGLPFQENIQTGDLRISGTLASLAGLEKALLYETVIEVDLAINRIFLLYGIILSMSGYPLLYMGDEAGQLNNYNYTDNSENKDDSRWVHRIPAADLNNNFDRYSRRIFTGLKKLIHFRKNCQAFTGNTVKI